MAEELESLIAFCTSHDPFEYRGVERQSNLVAGLRDCREATGRDRETGEIGQSTRGGNWLGAIGYFTVLDLLGSAFLLDEKGRDGIRAVLREVVPDLLEDDNAKIEALVALRNCFTHDFNLLNIPLNENYIPLSQHKFTVYPANDDTIVTLAKEVWNGDIENKNFHKTKDTTLVNLIGLGNLVEEAYSRIVSQLEAGELFPKTPIKYLINKYTFVTSKR
jgi:hypothetical protein